MKGVKLTSVTFDHTSAKDHLEKLRRECGRLEHAQDREQACDHLLNAFGTAWHLHEWVWDTIRDQPELRACVFAKFNISESDVKGSKNFGAELARRKPALEISRIIATSSKHVHVELYDSSPKSVGTAFSSTRSSNNPITDRITWKPKIVVDDDRVAASDLLNELDAFWVDLIYSCNIDRRD